MLKSNTRNFPLLDDHVTTRGTEDAKVHVTQVLLGHHSRNVPLRGRLLALSPTDTDRQTPSLDTTPAMCVRVRVRARVRVCLPQMTHTPREAVGLFYLSVGLFYLSASL